MKEIEYFKKDKYAELGFRCGLEIHQQLDTQKKLFCNCPVGLTPETPNMRIQRHMRPTLSELGEYDRTALMEFKTRKEVIYELYTSRTCTYEMDDTPPFPLNKQALTYAIEIALLLNCQLVDEVHVTRKQYLDGSIPTGFQRTAIIGVEGWIPYKGRRIGIAALTLEEDSCREVSDNGHVITWKTDRLSTPLVEVITKPDILCPQEVPEVNRLLGDLLRCTGKVRRGIGTIRQDVNVSVTGGTRVEIKGVPKVGYNDALTHGEAVRQMSFIHLSVDLKKKGLNSENILSGSKDITELIKGTDSLHLKRTIEAGGKIVAMNYRKCKGVFNLEVQPGHTFAEEVSGRVRVIACIDSKPNILHTDEPGVTGLMNAEWEKIRSALNSADEDLVVLLFGEKRDVETAEKEVVIRMNEALEGVPHETRQPFPDGHTEFERVLPGADRMYPDTDTPPTRITKEMVAEISSRLPELPWDRENRYLKAGLAEQVALKLSRSRARNIFDRVMAETKVPAPIAAHLLLRVCAELEKFIPLNILSDEQWVDSFKLLEEKKVSRNRFVDFISLLMARNEKGAAEVLHESALETVSEATMEETVSAVVEAVSPFDDMDSATAARLVIGEVMDRINYGFDGGPVMTKVMESLKKHY